MTRFVVSMQGDGVWHDFINVGIIDDTSEETLTRVRAYLGKRFGIKIEDFGIYRGRIVAKTSREDIEVLVEEVEAL